MMRRRPSLLMNCGRIARVNCIGNLALILIAISMSSAVFVSSVWTLSPPPTLLIKTVRFRSCRLATRSSICRGHVDEASATAMRNSTAGSSAVNRALTLASFVGFRPWSMTLNPFCASSWAKPRPMPSLAPVTRAQGLLPYRYRCSDDGRV